MQMGEAAAVLLVLAPRLRRLSLFGNALGDIPQLPNPKVSVCTRRWARQLPCCWSQRRARAASACSEMRWVS